MAFNPSTDNLWLEIKAAMEETEQHVDVAQSILRRMTGRWWRKDRGESEPDPENFGFAYISNLLPILGIENPEVAVEAARVIGHKVIAQAMEDGTASWIEDVNYINRLERVIVSFLTVRGVSMHYLEEDARFSRGIVTPACKWIDTRRFFQDALADTAEDDAFRGHWYWKDIDDLVADPEITPEAKAVLTPAHEDAAGPDGHSGDGWNRKSGAALGRKRVKCYSVWIRERNTIRVMVEASTAVELYPERPFYGPPCGPYQLYDAFPIPGSSWPLSSMVAVQDQDKDLNVHARAMGRAAARRKMFTLVEAANPDFAEKIIDAEDGEVIPVNGITGNHVNIENPGVTAEQYQYTEYIRNRLDRISGLTATVQGNVGAADTATEAKIADDALSNRTSYLKKKVIQATEASLLKIGWYLWHTEGIVIPVNRRDPYSGEQVEGLFFGGPTPNDQGASWDDFDIRIKINTMQREARAQQDMLGFYQVFIQLATMAPQMPWIRVLNIARDMAEAYNVPDKVDEWFIPELFGAFTSPGMFPVSQVIGSPGTPPRGASPFATSPRVGHRNPGEGFGQPGNQVGADGTVGGPRPQQTQGAGFNPMNAA